MLEPPVQLDAVHPRHPQVGENHVRRPLIQPPQRLLPIPGLEHLGAAPGEKPGHRAADRLIVLHDVNPEAGERRHCLGRRLDRPGGRGDGGRGRGRDRWNGGLGGSAFDCRRGCGGEGGGGGGGRGQAQDEPRATHCRGNESQVPTRVPGGLPRDVQSQSRATPALGRGERPKQPPRDLRRHSTAVVRDGDQDHGVLHPGVHREVAGRRHRAQRVDRVGEQVDHHLLQLDGVARDRRQVRVEAPAHRDLGHAEPVGDEVHRLPHHVVEVDRGDLALRDAHEVQQAVQELRGPLGLPQDLHDLRALLVREARLGDPVLRVRGDRRQRGVHLVRHARQQLARGREAVLILGALPQHARHLVEVLCECASFVVRRHGQFHREVSLRDTSQPRVDLAQRPQGAAPNQGDHERRAQGTQREPEDSIAQRLAGGGLHRPLPVEHVVAPTCTSRGGADPEEHVHGRRAGVDADRQQHEQQLRPRHGRR